MSCSRSCPAPAPPAPPPHESAVTSRHGRPATPAGPRTTEARLDEAIKHGKKVVKKQLKSDQKDLEAALDEAIKESKG